VSWFLLDSPQRRALAPDLPGALCLPDALAREVRAVMPPRPGTGKLQQQILAQLDGVPVDVADLVSTLAGPAPTQSQYTAIHNAVHSLARGQFVELSRVYDRPKIYRVLVLKVEPAPVHIRSSDRASGSDGEAPPVTPVQRYADLTDAAWEAFGTDCGYGVEIARAALKLLEREGTPVGLLVRDDDSGKGSSPEVARVRPR
jgi:hypothetical protein